MDSLLADNIWKAVRTYVDPYCRREAAQAIIELFEEYTKYVLHESRQLKKDATTEDIEDDWCPDYESRPLSRYSNPDLDWEDFNTAE